jgi:GMP synthase-like glutamine amidotransferase
MKVHIISGSHQYSRLFFKLGYTEVASVEEADLVCFTGGEDVTPALYGQKAHRSTYSNQHRDDREGVFFRRALELGIPMVGICRGAQFLNVMSGGAMYQDVSEHTTPHMLTDIFTGDEILVTSTHHQMMKPSKDAKIIATAKLGGWREHYDEKDVLVHEPVSEVDYEVVYYSATRCLCFQPHPEMVGESKTFASMVSYFDTLVAANIEWAL